MDPVPNNPLKRPLFAIYGGIGAVVAGYALVQGVWLLAALGVVVVVFAAICLRATAGGRNPRWLRSPLDRRR